MNQRLVWNFEFKIKKTTAPLKYPAPKDAESIKWEIRYFWPHDAIIVLAPIENSLLDLAYYQQKHREDYYYLLPGNNYNIKKRREETLYKPILRQVRQAIGFGAKVNIDYREEYPEKTTLDEPQLQHIAQQIAHEGRQVHVKKEAFVYKFPTKPTIKLELARLEVFNQVYFSACIEGKSLELVENIAEHLLDKQLSCDYVSFLKNILQ